MEPVSHPWHDTPARFPGGTQHLRQSQFLGEPILYWEGTPIGTGWLGIREGLRLLIGDYPYLWGILVRSAQVSGTALAISGCWASPWGLCFVIVDP